METILIAGGTGLIGKELQHLWRTKGHVVRILTRNATNVSKQLYQWDPASNHIDEQALEGVTVVVNLSGAGIGDKRWTKNRVAELYDSRIQTTNCLFHHFQQRSLKQYITASGIVCYGLDDQVTEHPESDPFGKDVLSDITEKWEMAADQFSKITAVTKLRISVVLSDQGGALVPLSKPVKLGIGVVLGNGKQPIPWIHISDMVRIFDFALDQRLEGAWNCNAGNETNRSLTRAIAFALHRPLWLPPVPGFLLRLVLGKMATVVLDGCRGKNEKLIQKGFHFEYPTVQAALANIFGKK